MFYRPAADPEIEKTNGEPESKTTQKVTEKIIEEIKKNSSITRKELADKVGISKDGVKYNLGNLKKLGMIKRVGPDKGGYWEVDNK